MANNEKSITLKKSFFGFNEQQVLSLIDELKAVHDAEMETKRKELLELSSKLEYVIKRTSDLQSQLDNAPQSDVNDEVLVVELASTKERLRDTLGINAQLQERLITTETRLDNATLEINTNAIRADEAEQKCAEVEAKLAEAEQKITEVVTSAGETIYVSDPEVASKLQAAEVKLLETEAKVAELNALIAEKDDALEKAVSRPSYDETSAQIGRIFIEAQTAATAIIERAEDRAFEIKNVAAVVANKSIDDLDGTQYVLKHLKEQMEEVVDKFNLSISNICFGLEGARNMVDRIKDEKDPLSAMREPSLPNKVTDITSVI